LSSETAQTDKNVCYPQWCSWRSWRCEDSQKLRPRRVHIMVRLPKRQKSYNLAFLTIILYIWIKGLLCFVNVESDVSKSKVALTTPLLQDTQIWGQIYPKPLHFNSDSRLEHTPSAGTR
jgi:hypothetical protein